MAKQAYGRQRDHKLKPKPSVSPLVVRFVSLLAAQSCQYYVNMDGQNGRL